MKTITISNRQMNPGVIHLNQYENSDHQIVFTLDDYMQGTVDVRKCNAYVVTSYGGELDITEVPFSVSGRTVTVTWNVSAWTLKEPGVILFQLRFSQTSDDGVVEWFSHKAVLVNRETINADDFVSAKYPTLLQSLINRIKDISGSLDTAIFYMQPGERVAVVDRSPGRLYYQIVDATTNEGYFEDHNGARLGAAEDAKYVSNCDFDKLLTSGEYVCFSTTGKGQPGNYQYGFLKVIQSKSCNYILQTFNYIEGGTVRTTQRSILVNADTIQPGTWTEVATSAALSGVQTQVNTKLSKNLGASNANKVIVTDGSGEIIALADVTSDNVSCLKGLSKNVEAALSGHDTTLNNHANTLSTQNSTLNSHTSTLTAHNTKLNNHAELIGDLQGEVNGKLDVTLGSNNANTVLTVNASGKVQSTAVTPTELSYLSGVTSSIQTQLNSKQATITGAASTIAGSNLTASKALVSNSSGKVDVSDVTSTELGYLAGATSPIQTQLNNKIGTLNYQSRQYRVGDYLSYYKLEVSDSVSLSSSSHATYIVHCYSNTVGKLTVWFGATIFENLSVYGYQMLTFPAVTKGSTIKFTSDRTIDIKVVEVPYK